MGTIICLVFGIFFFCLALLFAYTKAKGARYVSGFSTIPESERKNYDAAALVKDWRNACLVYALIFFITALLDHFISQYFTIAGLVIWLVLYVRNLSFDPDKAFEKYRRK
jgi:hypothetical protein